MAWRTLRAEQDKAYEESLKADREKVICRRTSTERWVVISLHAN